MAISRRSYCLDNSEDPSVPGGACLASATTVAVNSSIDADERLRLDLNLNLLTPAESGKLLAIPYLFRYMETFISKKFDLKNLIDLY